MPQDSADRDSKINIQSDSGIEPEIVEETLLSQSAIVNPTEESVIVEHSLTLADSEFPSNGQLENIIESGFSNISTSIEMAANISSNAGVTTVIYSALVAAFAAFIFNYFHWRIVARNERHSIVGNLLLSQIEDIEKISVEYWLQPYNGNNSTDLACMESTIKSLHGAIRISVSIYIKKIPRQSQKELEKQLDKFVGKLFDVATGGDFQTKSHSASRVRANQLLALCNNIKSKLAVVIFE